MPKTYARELREDVVRVARNRDAGTTVKQIAEDVGSSESWLEPILTSAAKPRRPVVVHAAYRGLAVDRGHR